MKKNTNELVHYYYSKIEYYYNDHFKNFSTRKSVREKVIDHLKTIIDKDRDYLLTDSFLDYCTSYGDYGLDKCLHALSCDNNEVIYCLMFYFLETMEEYLHRIKDHYLTFATLLDNDLHLIMRKLSKRIKPIEEIKLRGRYGRDDIKNIICIILAYYVINHKQGDLYEQCDVFLDDPENTLDSLYLNDIYNGDNTSSNEEEVNYLINYISYKIENNEQKEIK